MAGKKKLGRKPPLARFSAPSWLKDGYEEPKLRGWGFSAPGAIEKYTKTDFSNAPGVVALKLTSVRPIVVGNERMVTGLGPDGHWINISESEAIGDVEILSWHEIYEVRAPKIRETWTESRYRLEHFGDSSKDSRPHCIPETTVFANNKKRLSAD